MAMVSVSNEVDAEKLRSKYCGMVIDGSESLRPIRTSASLIVISQHSSSPFNICFHQLKLFHPTK